MAEITLGVGVKLQVLQSSISEMQKILDNLKPDSSGFKNLQKIIANMTNDLDKFKVQASRPFGSQAQFNQAEKTVDKLEEGLEKAKIAIDRIKFSDLKLDTNQIAQLDQFQKQLDNIKQSFVNFKSDLKEQFLNDDNNRAFINSINPNLVNKNFDEIVKNVENKTNSLKSILTEAEKKLEDFKNTTTLGTKIANIPEEGLVSRAGLGDAYDKFFQVNSKNVFSFKTGGGFKKGEIKQKFIEYLTEEFSLTSDQIAQIQNQTTAKAIKDLLANQDFFAPQVNAATTMAQEENAINSNYTTAKVNYENAANVLARLVPLLAALAVETEKADAEQRKVNQAFAQSKGAMVENAKGADDTKRSVSELTSGFENLRTQLGQTNSEWIALARQQATFNSLKSAITNFMGFNQILNLTKRAVQEATNHIKELDTVMNGIAIVTDMTTADLWNQVDTYSAMAQNYSVSIRGAYEVSQIYYQQGTSNI